VLGYTYRSLDYKVRVLGYTYRSLGYKVRVRIRRYGARIPCMQSVDDESIEYLLVYWKNRVLMMRLR
jgi:hypothetical protein